MISAKYQSAVLTVGDLDQKIHLPAGQNHTKPEIISGVVEPERQTVFLWPRATFSHVVVEASQAFFVGFNCGKMDSADLVYPNSGMCEFLPFLVPNIGRD
jgi:hypothetical protein